MSVPELPLAPGVMETCSGVQSLGLVGSGLNASGGSQNWGFDQNSWCLSCTGISLYICAVLITLGSCLWVCTSVNPWLHPHFWLNALRRKEVYFLFSFQFCFITMEDWNLNSWGQNVHNWRWSDCYRSVEISLLAGGSVPWAEMPKCLWFGPFSCSSPIPNVCLLPGAFWDELLQVWAALDVCGCPVSVSAAVQMERGRRVPWSRAWNS